MPSLRETNKADFEKLVLKSDERLEGLSTDKIVEIGVNRVNSAIEILGHVAFNIEASRGNFLKGPDTLLRSSDLNLSISRSLSGEAFNLLTEVEVQISGLEVLTESSHFWSIAWTPGPHKAKAEMIITWRNSLRLVADVLIDVASEVHSENITAIPYDRMEKVMEALYLNTDRE